MPVLPIRWTESVTRMPDRPTLSTARSGTEMCEAVARWCWWETHRSECPPTLIPTLPAINNWLASRDRKVSFITMEQSDLLRACLCERYPQMRAAWWMFLGLPTDDDLVACCVVPQDGLTSDEADALEVSRCSVPDDTSFGVQAMDNASSDAWRLHHVSLACVHAIWCALPPPRPHHPLVPLIGAWQTRAVERPHDQRADRRIMPTLKVVGPSPERERGMLFGGLVEDRPRTAELSLFPEIEPERHRVPLLEIVDAAGIPLRSRGRGAPLVARLIVRGGLLMIRPADRHLEIVRVAIEVQELLRALRPGRLRLAQDWSPTETALRTARDYTVPDATGGRWFPMVLRRLPALGTTGLPALNDLILLDLAPPPGAIDGPSMNLPELDLMGVTSGPRWRAYIAARSLIWVPGKTRRPVPRTRGRWGWSASPNDYPVLTIDDKRRLAFGDQDASNRRTRAAILSPWQKLPDVVVLPATDQRTGIRGWRLLPKEAKRALLSLTSAGQSSEE